MAPQIQILSSSDASVVKQTCAEHSLSPTEFGKLLQMASAAKKDAYCPYSNFRVGACLLTADGSYVYGANVENASYPVGTCAERVALGKAVVGGQRKFRAIAVSTDISPPASPCGMCRQFIREFCDLDCPVIMFDKDSKYVVLKLEELLPLSFGPESLPSPSVAAENASK